MSLNFPYLDERTPVPFVLMNPPRHEVVYEAGKWFIV